MTALTLPSAGKKTRSQSGFTLVELIVVIGIIAIMVAAVAPGLTDVIRAARLTSAGDQIIGRIGLAQQQALSLNSPVELRFYSYEDVRDGSGRSKIRAMQLVELLNDAAVSSLVGGGQDLAADLTQRVLNEPVYLESGVEISSDPTLSPLLTNLVDDQSNTFSVSGAKYAALVFYPDGSFKLRGSSGALAGSLAELNVTTPNLAQSYFTIGESREFDSGGSGGEPPANYYCIQLDSYTSKSRTYRP